MARKKRRIIAITAIKGGTGKTATAGALAMAATKDGKKTLCIDLDPQGDLSYWLRADFNRPGSHNLITGKATAPEAIQETESGINLMCASADLTALTTTRGSARRLENGIEPIIKNYDLILIDTAPAMGEIQNNALYAATGVIIPVQSDALSLQALYQMSDIINMTREAKPQLKALGSIITQYDSRPNVNRFMYDAIKEKGTERKIELLGAIRQGVAIREAITLQQPLYDYAPKSKPAIDYQDLYNKIMGV